MNQRHTALLQFFRQCVAQAPSSREVSLVARLLDAVLADSGSEDWSPGSNWQQVQIEYVSRARPGQIFNDLSMTIVMQFRRALDVGEGSASLTAFYDAMVPLLTNLGIEPPPRPPDVPPLDEDPGITG